MLNRIIRYFLENRVVTLLLLVLIIVWGISTSPFNWHGGIIPRNPIPVDAIPDIGDNQQWNKQLDKTGKQHSLLGFTH